jgi:hypothetical protein
MNQFTATFLWLAGTVGMAYLMMQMPLPQVVTTAVVFFMSFCLFWIVSNRVCASQEVTKVPNDDRHR